MRFTRACGALLTIALLVLLWPWPAASQSRIAVYKLAPDSPLATDGFAIYGVADDRRTLLTSSSGADWTVVRVRPAPRRISGIAWSRGSLYLSDELSGSVLRLRMAGQSNAQFEYNRAPTAASTEVMHQGAPFLKPQDLACTGSAVLVADPAAHTVFRLDTNEKTVETLLRGLPPGEIQLAADREAVVVASPETGEIRQPAPFEGPFSQKAPAPYEFSVWRTRIPGSDPVRVAGGPAGSVPRRLSPTVQRPTAPLLARGSLYLVDAATGAIYATPRQKARPTQVVPATAVKRPTRLLAIGESLLVLNAEQGVLVRWPLSVPTEIDLGQDPAAALDALYRALFERRLLPTQRAAWRGSLDETLRQEGVWEGSPSQPLASALCSLNPSVCVQGQWRLPATAPAILVPDVPIERVMDLATAEVQELGEGTLGDEVDRRVVTPTFFEYRQGSELWDLNANRLMALQKTSGEKRWGPYDAQTIRTRKRSDFPPGFSLTLPTEKQRALVALPRALLREDHWLSEIRLISPGFNWVPLEEVDAKGAFQPPPPPTPAPVACDMAALQTEHDALAKTIHYKLPQNLLPVKVGVVEKSGIDVQHPAFGGPTQAFTYISTPPSPAPPPTTPPTCRAATEDDHGTAVAGLIASRDAQLAGFAPNVLVVPVRSTDDDVGDDLLAAFRDRKAHIFNLSFHFESKLVSNIRQKIRELPALFVVAAGNDPTNKVPICESVSPYPAYPVCEGYRNNVLVVAATNAQGDALIEKTNAPDPPMPGSNWNDRLVQIAAPGIGYHAPVRNNGYASVRGTSFAAPLVTATAALLYAQGVTDPWLIKQRIIATADQKDNLLTKVFGAGLLNVERAVTTPEHAVLVKGATSKRVDLQLLPANPADPTQQSDVISIKWSGGSRTLPLANVRRLTKSSTGQTYRIVFLDDVTDTLVVQEIALASWPFKYQNVNPAGAPIAGIVSDQLENYDDYVGPIR